MTTTQNWNDLEGVSLAGRHWLKQCLMISEIDAWYVIRYDPTRDAAVRVVRGDLPFAEAQLNTWRGAMELDHPNVVRMLDAGRAEVEGASYIYCVCEFPDDFLEAALSARPLSTREAGDVLRACVSALRYLHGRGLAHGALTPRQIMAVGDRIKLPSDTVRRDGAVVAPVELFPSDPPEVLAGRPATMASDMWSLGMTLIEVLTRTRPVLEPGAEAPFLPEPFGSIAANTLRHDPAARWTIADVEQFLAPPAPPRAEPVPAPEPAPAAVARPEPEPQPEPERAAEPPRAVLPPPAPREISTRASTPFPLKWIPVAGLVAAGVISIFALRHPAPQVMTEPRDPEPVARPAAAPPPRVSTTAPAPAVKPPQPRAQQPRPQQPGAIWRVIVFQYSKRSQAENKARSINAKHAALHAEVYAPKGERGPFLISLGGRMTLPEAEKLKRQARAKGMPRDTFVRNYAD